VRNIISQRSDWHENFGFTSELMSSYSKEPSFQTHFTPQGDNLTDTFYTAHYESFDTSTHCFMAPVRKIISQRSDWPENFGFTCELMSSYFKEPSLQTQFILLITSLLTYPHIVWGHLWERLYPKGQMISPYFKEPSLQTHFIPQGDNVTDTFETAYHEHFDTSTHCCSPPVRKTISQMSDD
jgi:hypothetical protein